jgi:hypothetical protein
MRYRVVVYNFGTPRTSPICEAWTNDVNVALAYATRVNSGLAGPFVAEIKQRL